YSESLRGGDAYLSDVVPSDLVDRLGKLLEPSVVRVTTVVDAGVGPEENRNPTCRNRQGRKRGGRGRHGDRRVGSVVENTTMNRIAPSAFEVAGTGKGPRIGDSRRILPPAGPK